MVIHCLEVGRMGGMRSYDVIPVCAICIEQKFEDGIGTRQLT